MKVNLFRRKKKEDDNGADEAMPESTNNDQMKTNDVTIDRA